MLCTSGFVDDVRKEGRLNQNCVAYRPVHLRLFLEERFTQRARKTPATCWTNSGLDGGSERHPFTFAMRTTRKLRFRMRGHEIYEDPVLSSQIPSDYSSDPRNSVGRPHFISHQIKSNQIKYDFNNG